MAEFFTRIGDFETSKEIFEEAIDCRSNGVSTIRDLTLVFNSYIQFELTLLKLNFYGDKKDKFSRIEELLFKRPFLFCEVALSNNKNDVREWLKIINLSE